MNHLTFDSLPEDIQQALEEKVFGGNLSREFGKVWQQIDDEGRHFGGCRAQCKNCCIRRCHSGNSANRKKMNAKELAELNKAGIDAEAAFEMIEAELAAY
ncbi:MAG: hypothetical protein OXI87_14885 [Albidovulum sp.]|nr:hypothetical protein [Albidovulum sp.]MDE0306142.1 hypothetical protein [Albidovulum sp.]